MTALTRQQIVAKFHKSVKPLLDSYISEISKESGCTERNGLLCLQYIKNTEPVYQEYLLELSKIGVSPFDNDR